MGTGNADIVRGVSNARDLRDMLGLAQNTQLEINTVLLHPFEADETNDLAQGTK